MEAIDQGAATSSHEEENLVIESGDPLTYYFNPLAQQPPMADTSFHPPMEGSTNSPDEPKYGTDARFLRTYMG